MVGVVKRLPRHLLRREQAEVDDLEADLLERAPRLGLDLPARLLEPPLAIRLQLIAHAALVGVGDPPGVAEDLFGLRLGLADQAAVLLQELSGLFPRVVGLFERLADP